MSAARGDHATRDPAVYAAVYAAGELESTGTKPMWIVFRAISWMIAGLFSTVFLVFLLMDALDGTYPDNPGTIVLVHVVMVLYIVVFISTILSRWALVRPQYHRLVLSILVAAIVVEVVLASLEDIHMLMKLSTPLVWSFALMPLIYLPKADCKSKKAREHGVGTKGDGA